MTQQVKLLVPLSVKGKNQKAGDVIELEDDQAEEYVLHAWAEKIDEKPATPASDPA